MRNADFNESLKRLEEIVSKMDNSDLSLSDSIELFEEGIALTKFCQKSLREAEAKIKLLVDKD